MHFDFSQAVVVSVFPAIALTVVGCGVDFWVGMAVVPPSVGSGASPEVE